MHLLASFPYSLGVEDDVNSQGLGVVPMGNTSIAVYPEGFADTQPTRVKIRPSSSANILI